MRSQGGKDYGYLVVELSSIKLTSNIASLGIQRQLGQSMSALLQSYTRLSSGLRINKASDDAAGLAVSEYLLSDVRVYSQAVRNINDAVSMLNVAEGALLELSNILTRQLELAQQASNGTYSDTQRDALDQEAQVLSEEYQRIVASTSYNNSSLLSGDVSNLQVQAGYGKNESLSFSIGDNLAAHFIGDGTFQDAVSYSNPGGATAVEIVSGDFNGDGFDDLVNSKVTSTSVSISLANGDGSFNAPTFFLGGSPVAPEIEVADANNDGKLDLVAFGGGVNGDIEVALGNGDGTFKTFSLALDLSSIALTDVKVGDMNNDGSIDIVYKDSGGSLGTLLGNGDGSFSASVSNPVPGGWNWCLAISTVTVRLMQSRIPISPRRSSTETETVHSASATASQSIEAFSLPEMLMVMVSWIW